LLDSPLVVWRFYGEEISFITASYNPTSTESKSAHQKGSNKSKKAAILMRTRCEFGLLKTACRGSLRLKHRNAKKRIHSRDQLRGLDPHSKKQEDQERQAGG